MTEHDDPRVLAHESAAHLQIGNVPVFNGDLNMAVRTCLEWIEAGVGGRVATANLDFLAIARKDMALKRLLAQSHLVVADGAPVAWLARLAGARATRRAGGVDLVTRLLGAGVRRGGLKVALYGATPDVCAVAAQRVEDSYPGVEVVAAISPPFGPRDLQAERHARDTLQQLTPELVLVALGCPKQEQVISDFYEVAPAAVWIGVGGTLDILAGHRRRAPQLMQRLGLEWAARLAQEPGRLWHRYFLRDLPVLASLTPPIVWSAIVRSLARPNSTS